ncbi:MAG: hypothetical protein Q8K79_01740 [Solirubrobacteraceae bacterium]|nr:hypothetical protein [Solirubrobacteraceae bacterium]
MRHPRALVLAGLAALALLVALVLPAAAAAAAAPQQNPPPLSIGLTENDPRLLIPTGPTRRAAAKVVALKPAYVRVLIPWERLQPRAGRKPNWDAPLGGCPKINPGCRSERGMRGLLNAIKQRQAQDGGWRILAVPYFTPLWAMAAPPTGCQKARNRHARAQMPRIAHYRRLLRAFNALADKVGVPVDFISPWNEPNHPAFLQPQRARCSADAKAVSPRAYARLVRAARHELRPHQTLVLGSLAGLQRPRVYGAGVAEFIRGLPHDVACLDVPFAQHAYIGVRARDGGPPRAANPGLAARRELLDSAIAALDAKECGHRKSLWIAETGTFDHRCAAMSAALRSWAVNDRISAAFQFTFRESRDFPVGLVSPSLFDTYASYRAWRAFSGSPRVLPDDPC